MRYAYFIIVIFAISLTAYSQPYEPEHLWYRWGDTPNDWFGYRAAGIGDVNGDACDDFIVNCHILGSQTEAYVMLFYGGNPPDTIPDILFYNPYPYGGFGGGLENVGDVNGDGEDDIAVHGAYPEDEMQRVFIYFGGDLLDTIPDIELSEPPIEDFFGSNIEGIGDVNGDGYDDIAVSSGNYGEQYGKVWVYLGGNPMDTIADWSQEGSGPNVGFGRSIAGKGDLNGDNYDDFVIFEWTGYPNYSQTSFYVYFGNVQLDTIPDLIIDGEDYYPDVSFSEPSALIPDLNGDQYSDLVIVAGRTTNAVVFYGGDPMDTEIDVILGGFDPNPPGYYMNVSFAGDVNRDGYGDIIVAQLDAYGYGGLVNVYLGNPWMTVMYSMQWWGIGNPWDGCGVSLTDCGDINGDGVDDIMFGSLYGTNCGRIDIWKGDTAFVADVPSDIPHPIPHSFLLLPPYPNPFNSSVTIPFEIFDRIRGDISLIVYNVLGQMVMDLRPQAREAMSRQASGPYEIIWNGKDIHGKDCSSGVYVIILQWGVHRQLRKVVMMK